MCFDNLFELCRTAVGDLDCVLVEYLVQLGTCGKCKKMCVYEVEELFFNGGFD